MNVNFEISGGATVTNPHRVKIAACQYAIELFEDWDAYARHLAALVEQAVTEGAELLLLPEYAGMALTGQLPPGLRSDLQGSITAMQDLIPRWFDFCASLARQHGVWFCPGTLPVLDDDGIYRNRCWLFGPDGVAGHQDKLIMTRFEREQWFIGAGAGLRVFETPFARIGILICYDNEFPALGRQLVEAGADLILAPSCTDTMAGYRRVRIGCRQGPSRGRLRCCSRRRPALPTGRRQWISTPAGRRSICRRITACRMMACWHRAHRHRSGRPVGWSASSTSRRCMACDCVGRY
ncbi:nitrilase-related carbon-nitrogen hydrolase [Marinobacterium aestuariivivens]|uniref:Nitrilase-related carbon-nitrogen hydrolase n=1 Tax=Marinobacterium aestuariivivens TaxID=1698799 RepID=A0ABW1ZYT4_9GAMM